jgi:Leucine-rich repeat (LRR) protein
VEGKIKNGGNFFDINGLGGGSFEQNWIDKLPGDLSVINCSFNKFKTLPDALSKFAKLTQFFGAGNQLSQWPISLCGFLHLTELEINGNDLKTLPTQFGRLQALEKFNIANNKLTSLPQTLGYCFHLEELNISGNELDVLPDAIGNLYHLEVLDASCNALVSLPEELTYCTRLIELNLGGNRLAGLPEAIGRLSRVVNLNVSDNSIHEFPVSIGYCASLAQIGQGLNIDRNPLKDPELQQQFRVGADRLYMYLEKRMFIEGSPKLPPFPNNGKLPYVPLPPIDGEMLSFGTAGSSSKNLLSVSAANPGSGSASPISFKNRKVYDGASGGSGNVPSPAIARTASPAPASPAASRDEKVDKIRSVAKVVIDQDIRPKIQALKAQIDGSKSVQEIQPFVLKAKSLKNDFDAIKTVLPALDNMPKPERNANEEQLVTFKKVVNMLLFEYDLVLSISLSVADVASSKDLITLVNALKKVSCGSVFKKYFDIFYFHS